MEHQGSFDSWWGSTALCNTKYCSQAEYYSTYDISREEFLKFSFKNGFNKGDLMVLVGKEPKDINTGDIIVFQGNRQDPVIHRVIKKWHQDDQYHFQTKGDRNERSYHEVRETDITEERIIGTATARIPFLGWIKIIFVNIINILR